MNIVRYMLLALFWGSCSAAAMSEAELLTTATITSTQAPEYVLPAEIQALIEKYQSDEFIDAVVRDTTKFEDPDFIHRVVHRREAARESIDALNKKIIYEFPFFMRTGDKSIGILGSDVIGVGTHLMQKFLDRSAMKAFINDLASVLAQEAVHHGEQLVAMLTNHEASAAATILADAAWIPKTARPLLIAHLKRRLPFAALEYAKKSVTPLPFFMHGKTKEGREVDGDTAQIAPITSVIPVFAIDGVIDPILNSSMLTGNTNFQWNDPYGERINTLLAINAGYALEGAKQLEWIGDMDEGLFFIIAKELAVSMLFFHRELRGAAREVIQRGLWMQGPALKELLAHNIACQKDLTLAPDVRSACDKEAIKNIEILFKTALGGRGGELLRSLRQAQCTYNVVLTGALLAPVAFKVIKFGWKFLRAVKATDGGDKK